MKQDKRYDCNCFELKKKHGYNFDNLFEEEHSEFTDKNVVTEKSSSVIKKKTEIRVSRTQSLHF